MQVAATITLKPVRKILVYILPHSHHDLGYTDLQANVEEKQMRNITLGMDLARRTAAYPEGARFVWNLEVLWGADLLMRRKTEAEKTAFIQAVKKGWVALNGMYANELTGLCRPEELLQLFRFGGELGRTCGVSVDSAMVSDVPGFTWGTVTAMAHAGIRYFSVGAQLFRPDRHVHASVAGQAILVGFPIRQRKGSCLGPMDRVRNVPRHESWR